jgi:hypothetical protein
MTRRFRAGWISVPAAALALAGAASCAPAQTADEAAPSADTRAGWPTETPAYGRIGLHLRSISADASDPGPEAGTAVCGLDGIATGTVVETVVFLYDVTEGTSGAFFRVDPGAHMRFLGFRSAEGMLKMPGVERDVGAASTVGCHHGVVPLGIMSFVYIGGGEPDTVRLMPRSDFGKMGILDCAEPTMKERPTAEAWTVTVNAGRKTRTVEDGEHRITPYVPGGGHEGHAH